VGGDAAEGKRHCKTIELFVPVPLERIKKTEGSRQGKGIIAILNDWQKFH